jgi:hypothetical protein
MGICPADRPFKKPRIEWWAGHGQEMPMGTNGFIIAFGSKSPARVLWKEMRQSLFVQQILFRFMFIWHFSVYHLDVPYD